MSLDVPVGEKFNYEQLKEIIKKIKEHYKSNDISFVLYAHPNRIDKIFENTESIFDEYTKINDDIFKNVHYKIIKIDEDSMLSIISTDIISENEGMKLYIFPNTNGNERFKFYKYNTDFVSSINKDEDEKINAKDINNKILFSFKSGDK